MPTIIAVSGETGTRYRVQVRLKGAAPQSATSERKTDDALPRSGRERRPAVGVSG